MQEARLHTNRNSTQSEEKRTGFVKKKLNVSGTKKDSARLSGVSPVLDVFVGGCATETTIKNVETYMRDEVKLEFEKVENSEKVQMTITCMKSLTKKNKRKKERSTATQEL